MCCKGYGFHLEYFDHLGDQDYAHRNENQNRQNSAKGLVDSRLAIDSKKLWICKAAERSD